MRDDAQARSAASGDWAVMSRPAERVVTIYPSREEAEAALVWYTQTYSPPEGSLYVKEVVA